MSLTRRVILSMVITAPLSMVWTFLCGFGCLGPLWVGVGSFTIGVAVGVIVDGFR